MVEERANAPYWDPQMGRTVFPSREGQARPTTQYESNYTTYNTEQNENYNNNNYENYNNYNNNNNNNNYNNYNNYNNNNTEGDMTPPPYTYTNLSSPYQRPDIYPTQQQEEYNGTYQQQQQQYEKPQQNPNIDNMPPDYNIPPDIDNTNIDPPPPPSSQTQTTTGPQETQTTQATTTAAGVIQTIDYEKMAWYRYYPNCFKKFFEKDQEYVISRSWIYRFKLPRHFQLIQWILWGIAWILFLAGVGGGIYVWYRFAMLPSIFGIDPYTGESKTFKILATSPDEYGIFAVGSRAYGIFAAGHLAFGVVAVGQVAIGLISLGQAGVGLLFMVGQAVLSIGFVPIAQVCVSSYNLISQGGVALIRTHISQFGLQIIAPFFTNINEYTNEKAFEQQASRQVFVTCHKKKNQSS